MQVAKFIHEHPDYFSRVKRAWAVWALSKLSFSGNLSGSFSFAKNGNNKKTIALNNAKHAFGEDIKALLEQCTIEQDDALKVIKRYDTKDTFHFLDPPYIGFNMGHYSGMFDRDNMQALLDLLSQIEGKFMLTMYPDDMIRKYANDNSWIIHKIERVVSASNSVTTKRRKQEEWMVVNYHIENDHEKMD